MKNHGSAERGAKRVLKQAAALGAVAIVAVLALAAADRAEALAPRRDLDERIRTRVAFEVEERGLVADRSASAYTTHWTRVSVSLSRRAWCESGTAAARRNANTDERCGTR
jgi:hypothetical protein